MPIKNDREYRNLGTFEVSEDYHVRGYASTFDTYPLYEEDGVTYYERIDRHAFDNADMSDVVFLRDHTGTVLARTKNDSLKLGVDDHGLWVDIDLSLTEASRAMFEDIKVRNYTQMSFSFTVAESVYDRETRTRIIVALRKLYDTSSVAFPANPYTEIGLSARDYFHGEMEAEKAERLEREKREAEKARLALRIKVMKGVIHGNH